MHQPLLDRARAFHTDLDEVVDPDRLLYIAGYDRKTPFLLELEAPAKFTYGETSRVTGVPHALGLLDAVKTYWVDEDHGDLPKNDDVLEAISDLLRGETSKLAAKKPVTRGATRKPRPGRKTVEAVPAEAERILASAKRRRRADGEPDLTPEEEARLEALVADNYLGSGDEGERAAGTTEEEPTGVTARTRPPAITIEVSWGDVTKIEADVYAVGHYQGSFRRTRSSPSTAPSPESPRAATPFAPTSSSRGTPGAGFSVARSATSTTSRGQTESAGGMSPSPAWGAPAPSTTARSYA